MTQPLPWSPSAISSIENCPRQHHEVKVLKRVKEKPRDANEWGIRVHKNLEDASAQRSPLPIEVAYLQPLVDTVDGWRKLVKQAGTGFLGLEYKMAIDKDMKPCNFFGKDVFGRLVSDVIYVMPSEERGIILDWKTGKRKVTDQMLYNALLAFITFPKVQMWRTDFVWIKDAKRDPEIWTRDKLPEYWQRALPSLKNYRDTFKRDLWLPRESGLCNGWCPVQTCEFWKPGKQR